jgi:AcrR family transcriptional regulator
MYRASNAPPRNAGAKPLYRKLRPRPNGPPRENVVANQRSRLHGATVEAVASRGYARTSVAELCRLAGVSKRTFYEQFENKDACVLASYERIVAATATRARAAASSAAGREQQLDAVLGALLCEARDRPKAARFALIESRAGGPALLARREGRRAELERTLMDCFAGERADREFPSVLIEGIVSGIEHAVVQAIRADQLDDVETLTRQLSRWASSYRSPALACLPTLPAFSIETAGQPGASRRTPYASRRGRVLRAAADLALTEGLEHLTFGRIAICAGIEEGELSELYESPGECFLDAIDLLGLEGLICASAASRAVGDGLEGACVGILALIERIAADRVMCGVILEEGSVAGSTADQRRERLLGGPLNLMLSQLPLELDKLHVQASTGALWDVLRRRMRRGGAQGSLRIGNYLVYLALAPLAGADAVSAALTQLQQARKASPHSA